MVVDPEKLFNSLTEDFDDFLSCSTGDGSHLPSQHPAVESLASKLFKKFVGDHIDTSVTAAKAIESFETCNLICEHWSPPKDGILARMKHKIASQLPFNFGWKELLCNCMLDMGPGASIASRGRNSFLEKLFLNEFTTTNGALYREYREWTRDVPDWDEAENKRSALHASQFVVVEGATVTTVRKDSTTDRTISTQPSLNMLFQKAVSTLLEQTLHSYYGFDSALQPERNRELARKGSISDDLATIDLKEASNLGSLTMVRELFPSHLVAAIEDCRVPLYSVDDGVTYKDLHICSLMGNGFTFSLMTYIFTVLLDCVCEEANVPFTPSSNWEFGVFGDDIICPTALAPRVIEVLDKLGYLVNEEKSFLNGPFRESCGGDFWKGTNIRPVYCKRLDSFQDVYSLLNRLNRWSALHGVELKSLQSYLLSVLKESPDGILLVPPHESDVSGLHVPRELVNSDTYVSYIPKIRSVPILSKEFFGPTEEGVFGRTRTVLKSFDNLAGIAIAIEHGLVVSRGVTRESEITSYKKVLKRTPGWDSPYELGLVGVTFRKWRRLMTFGRICGLRY